MATRESGKSMSSAAGSPARTSATSAKGKGSRATAAGFGANTRASFAFYDRGSLSWKTFQGSLLGGWAEFSETWPPAGMTRNGRAYRLRPLVPITFGSGFGWWPTPGANDWKGSSKWGQRRGQLDEAAENLPAWVPCPCCENYWCLIHNAHAHECPCPPTEDWLKDPYGSRTGLRLHPEFSEWLMGFPIGWTEFGHSETPLMSASPSGSAGG